MFTVNESKTEIKVADYSIAAGDLANEVGKSYMESLRHAIENNFTPERTKVYFLTSIRKNPTNLKEIIIYILPMLEYSGTLRESMDLWVYDYKKEKLNLLWSIPHRTEMKNFLRAPEKYSKDLIKWIKQYLRQENINLYDNSAQIIS